ncbi:MAG: formyltransferase [Candidatus Rokuibacteriota bacterium]|nr:MAG: formyltransferase [Candidatus Rokubacteria bacterium]
MSRARAVRAAGRRGAGAPPAEARLRTVVFAYHTIGARALEALLARREDVIAVVTHADDPGEGDWFESVAGLARAHRLPCLTPSSPNRPELIDALRPLAPDLLLSVWYRRLLGPALLALPRVAALNLHGSLLPRYRGRAPLNWVLVNGEERTGVTLHHMNEAADAGDIVAQRPIDIAPDDTALTLYQRMVKEGVDLLLETLPAVVAGTAPRVPQDHARATTVGRRRPEDGRIEWTWPAVRIANMIRAVTHPFPGAFAGDGSARLWLWAGSPLPEAPHAALPGTLLEIVAGRGVTVATGVGALLLTRVQSGGGAEEPADAWATYRRLRPGMRLTEVA